MIKNDGKDNIVGRQLESMIKSISYEMFYGIAQKLKLLCMEPVIVKKVNSVDNTATISFPMSPNSESSIYFPIKSNQTFVSGQKAYLIHIIDNQDQGFLIDNKPFKK